MTDNQSKPITEQAKDAIAAAGQKASDAWEATQQKASEVGSPTRTNGTTCRAVLAQNTSACTHHTAALTSCGSLFSLFVSFLTADDWTHQRKGWRRSDPGWRCLGDHQGEGSRGTKHFDFLPDHRHEDCAILERKSTIL